MNWDLAYTTGLRTVLSNNIKFSYSMLQGIFRFTEELDETPPESSVSTVPSAAL